MNSNEIDKIIEIIDWYRLIPYDYNEVNELMYKRQQLSALVFNFSNLVVGKLAEAWKIAEAKTDNEKYAIRAREERHGVTQARTISKANTWKELLEQKEKEGMYLAAKHKERTMYEVLASMNQHISHLKEELKYSRYTNEK